MDPNENYESMGLGIKDTAVSQEDETVMRNNNDMKLALVNSRLPYAHAYSDMNLQPIPWSVISQKTYPEGQWRIKNLVPLEGFVILASISGEKKSWIALEMARCISEGEDFLGQKEFAVKPANVVYIDGENPQAEINRRGKQLGFKDNAENALDFINADGLNMGDDETAENLIKMIEREKYQVIIVDTVRAVAGAIKEDKAEEIRQFFNRYKCLKDKGVTIIFLDHVRKPNNMEGKIPKKEQLLGSQDKTASVEVLLMVRSESGTNEIDVYQRKNRLGVEIKPFRIMMEDQIADNGVKSTMLTYGGEIESDDTKKEEAREIILSLMQDGEERSTKQFISALQKQVGQKNIRAALRELVEENILEVFKSGSSNHYKLSSSLKEIVQQGLLDNF